jgi:predicted regulator of Ras-like GTPase activity (Roadblock/LC7/MglB family)
MLAAPSPAESFTLAATTAAAARREAVQRFPQGGSLKGYVEGDSEAVYLSSVREKGNKTYVATAFRNRAPRPTRFVFEPSSK